MIRAAGLFLFCAAWFLLPTTADTAEQDGFFAAQEAREEFTKEVSGLIAGAWRDWQNNIEINNVYVDGSKGSIKPVNMDGGFLTAGTIVKDFDTAGKPARYISSVRVLAKAVAAGMRLWQKGYTNSDIAFPQGASCVYTLTPCYNMPAAVASGVSRGDAAMKEGALYEYMFYHSPGNDESVLKVFKAASRAAAECFEEWKSKCLIKEIRASGGIAPQPSPIGSGPGPVKGARGFGGRLRDAYFDGDEMYKKMLEYMEV